ncbi:MAG: hypothetical protein MUF48_07400 [Pirellulaceae bacterium]|jgi:hypothetical protein|nr:hypothetical protein [Pirellulaceae bacterium]
MTMAQVPADAGGDQVFGHIRLPFGHNRGGGFLTVPYAGKIITAKYFPAKMDLLLALNDALLNDIDAHVPCEAQGWKSAEALIELLEDPLQQVQNLRGTICQINRKFADAAAKVLPGMQVPRLVESQRRIGVRLQWPFHIVRS